MMRWTLGLALLALAGCNEKKETPGTTTVAPATTPTTTVTPPPAAAADLAVAPPASGEAAKPSGEAARPEKTAKPAAKVPLQPPGIMPHGSPEEGTLKYNPPAVQNPPPKTDKPTKK